MGLAWLGGRNLVQPRESAKQKQVGDTPFHFGETITNAAGRNLFPTSRGAFWPRLLLVSPFQGLGGAVGSQGAGDHLLQPDVCPLDIPQVQGYAPHASDRLQGQHRPYPNLDHRQSPQPTTSASRAPQSASLDLRFNWIAQRVKRTVSLTRVHLGREAFSNRVRLAGNCRWSGSRSAAEGERSRVVYSRRSPFTGSSNKKER